jgi:hypothetical protein
LAQAVNPKYNHAPVNPSLNVFCEKRKDVNRKNAKVKAVSNFPSKPDFTMFNISASLKGLFYNVILG